jgi:hypothetical protein
MFLILTLLRSFEVSFQDVGGLLDEQMESRDEQMLERRRGSSAGCSWSRKSRRKSSQKSNPDSFQLQQQYPSPSPEACENPRALS